MISQYILTGILLFLEFYFATADGGSRSAKIGICLIILAGIGLVWQPEFSNVLAHAIGISRGADLLMYLWILISFLIIGRLRLRLWRLEHEITLVVRQMALMDAARHPPDSAGR